MPAAGNRKRPRVRMAGNPAPLLIPGALVRAGRPLSSPWGIPGVLPVGACIHRRRKAVGDGTAVRRPGMGTPPDGVREMRGQLRVTAGRSTAAGRLQTLAAARRPCGTGERHRVSGSPLSPERSGATARPCRRASGGSPREVTPEQGRVPEIRTFVAVAVPRSLGGLAPGGAGPATVDTSPGRGLLDGLGDLTEVTLPLNMAARERVTSSRTDRSRAMHTGTPRPHTSAQGAWPSPRRDGAVAMRGERRAAPSPLPARTLRSGGLCPAPGATRRTDR